MKNPPDANKENIAAKRHKTTPARIDWNARSAMTR
jgi:hypothetical protein